MFVPICAFLVRYLYLFVYLDVFQVYNDRQFKPDIHTYTAMIHMFINSRKLSALSLLCYVRMAAGLTPEQTRLASTGTK
jgi:NhaP-type Na+/H+ or K+/H+ antiporter